MAAISKAITAIPNAIGGAVSSITQGNPGGAIDKVLQALTGAPVDGQSDADGARSQAATAALAKGPLDSLLGIFTGS